MDQMSPPGFLALDGRTIFEKTSPLGIARAYFNTFCVRIDLSDGYNTGCKG
jgi:hypothetical protein